MLQTQIGTYTALKKLSELLLILMLALIMSGCAFSNSNSDTTSIWFDEILITTGVDENREPVDSITEVEYGIDELICFMSLTSSGPVSFPVAWYHEDRLLTSGVITFGDEQKGEFHLLKNKERDPLPSGSYRCEWGPIGTPLRVIELEILEPTNL